MYQKKREADVRCPMEYGLSVFGGKWSARILCVLASCGTLRYGRIREEMVDITDTVLTDTLKHLAEEDMIVRRAYDEIPPRVEYSLTPRGYSVIPILQSICRWAGAQKRIFGENVMRQCLQCDYHGKTEEAT